jgi:hypothetical protein
MTDRFSRPAMQAFPVTDHDPGLEGHPLPVSVWLCATVLAMNVVSAVLSLIA